MEPAVQPRMEPAVARLLRRRILAWYRREGRQLAIRTTRDPYAILVAEVMAQQTQISRVEPAWRSFLARFPTVSALAAAPPADVIRAWAGLGYNGRAVRLREAAVAIVRAHGSRVPATVAELGRLPGIGPYTARAVAATAFGRRAAPVDTNVRRVVGRIVAGHGHAGDPGRPLPAAALQAAADALVPPRRADTWTHALMDLGAAVCRPVPRCATCPALVACRYAAEGLVALVDQSRPASMDRAGSSVRFESTSRWLRGRLLAIVRAADDGEWVALPARVGVHGRGAIEAALDGLARDRLLERDGHGRARLPSSTALARPLAS